MYTTRYQLLVVINGQNDQEVTKNGSFEIVVSAEKGWVKPKTEEDTSLKYKSDYLWNEIQASNTGKKYDEIEYENTVLNLDEVCYVDGTNEYQTQNNMFSSQKY